MYRIARESSRLVANVEGGIAEVTPARETGFAFLNANGTVEQHDLSIAAHLTSIRSGVPFCVHGSSGEGEVECMVYDELAGFISAAKEEASKTLAATALSSNASSPSEEFYRGMFSGPSCVCSNQILVGKPAESYSQIPDLLQGVLTSLRSPIGREYNVVDYYGSSDAKIILIAMGDAAHGLEKHYKSNQDRAEFGLIVVRLYRPWPEKYFVNAVPKTADRFVVIDQGTETTPLYLDVAATLHSASWNNSEQSMPVLLSVKYTNVFTHAMLEQLLSNANAAEPVTVMQLGKAEPHPTGLQVGRAAVATAAHHDILPYTQLLQQIFKDRLRIINATQDSNIEASFGLYITTLQKRERLLGHASKLVKTATLNQSLKAALTNWVSNHTDADLSDKYAKEVISLLEADKHNESLKEIYELREHFVKLSLWILGCEEWAYDLQFSGIHHVISSGEPINLLLVDNEVYSNRPKSPTERRKKDVGLYAMNYGNTYVASVAIYSNYTQVLHSLLSADSYLGPSVVLAYLPKILHKEGDTIAILKETKIAVDLYVLE